MKKIKTLIPVLILSTPILTTSLALTSCNNKNKDSDDEKHVSDVKVVGEIIVNQPAVVTFSIDSAYTLDLNKSTIKFEDSNAEAFTLNECEINMTEKQITIPAHRVTSTKPTINLVSMKINSEITLDEVKQELTKALFSYEGKNLVTTYTQPGFDTKSIVYMKDMNVFSQFTEVDPSTGESETWENQGHYLDQYKGWIVFTKNWEQTSNTPVFSANQCYTDMLTYIFLDLDWDKLTKDEKTGAYTGQLVQEEYSETITNNFYFFFNKNKQLDHAEIKTHITYTQETKPDEEYRSNCYFDWSKSAEFDLWTTPDISKCNNYFNTFTQKQDAKILYSILNTNVLNCSYSIAFDVDLSKYTTFDPTKPLSMKYKPDYEEHMYSTKATIKVNGSKFLDSSNYSYDTTTNILTINANVLQPTDKLFIAIGEYYMPFGRGMGGVFDTFIIKQPDSIQTNTVYFHKSERERETLVSAILVNNNTAIGELPAISPGLYWAYRPEEQGQSSWEYLESSKVITASLDVYPAPKKVVLTETHGEHISEVYLYDAWTTYEAEIHVTCDSNYVIDSANTTVKVGDTTLELETDYTISNQYITIHENKITDPNLTIHVEAKLSE